MPNQLASCKNKNKAPPFRSKTMVTAFACLSTSFVPSARAAFVRNQAFRPPSFANRVALSTKVTLPSSRMRHGPTSLASSAAKDYDLLNKEKGLDSYSPNDFEKEIYAWWENSGCFQPDAKQKPTGEKEPYVLPMPPPNVTGRLHMGHAIFVALQDVLARFHRMRGRPVLWLPGKYFKGKLRLIHS